MKKIFYLLFFIVINFHVLGESNLEANIETFRPKLNINLDIRFNENGFIKSISKKVIQDNYITDFQISIKYFNDKCILFVNAKNDFLSSTPDYDYELVFIDKGKFWEVYSTGKLIL